MRKAYCLIRAQNNVEKKEDDNHGWQPQWQMTQIAENENRSFNFYSHIDQNNFISFKSCNTSEYKF